jgi:Ca2+-binding EF-hand superfamily protein
MKGDKLDKHEKALQETQLVKVANKETLEGLVDIPKVKEIRRALRRRYGNRLNYHKIFSSWDRDRKGYLNLTDIHYMINQMGISINEQEAQVLIASHDHEGNGRLAVEEFMDLIFSTNDNMNVDLSKLRRNAEPGEIVPDEDIMRGIQNDAAKLKQMKDKKMFKYVLQKSLKELFKEFKEMDEEKTGEVDFKQFEKAILLKVQLPRYIKENNSLFVNLFEDQEVNDQGRINYNKFCKGLRNFRYLREADINIDLGQGKDEPIKTEERKEEVKTGNQIHIFDIQKVPSHQLERIFTKTLKVTRILQAKFKTSESLATDLKGKVNADINGNIKSKDFEDYLLNTCKEELKKRKLSRRDLEGFLSSFVYSVHKTTDVNAVAPLVFSDDTQISAKIHSLQRALPPPMNVAQSQDSKSVSELSNPVSQIRIREVIIELQEKSFEDKKYLYQVFRDYDRDGDGYISHDDIKKQFKNLHVKATEEEVNRFIELVDPSKKGYLDFPSFSWKVSPNMVESLAPLENTLENNLFRRYRQNLVPNRLKLEENIEYHKTFANRFLEIRNKFLPETDSIFSKSLIVRNRFDSSYKIRGKSTTIEYFR